MSRHFDGMSPPEGGIERRPSPVRGGTLPWGELSREIDDAARPVPWPPPNRDLPPASAVRGGTLPYGLRLSDLVPDELFLAELELPQHEAERPPRSLRELLGDPLKMRAMADAPDSLESDRDPSDEQSAPSDLTSAIQGAADRGSSS